MQKLTLQDMLGTTPPPAGSVLEGDAVQKLFWRIKGSAREVERERAFWQSTNETLTRAYEELREARDRIAAQQEAIHKLVASEKERLERELKLAARIQTSILPRAMGVEGLSVAARMVPATEVGGDYYEVLPIEGGAWLGIGDVAGHGLSTGLVMLMIQSAVAALCTHEPSATPAGVLASVNALIYDNVRGRLLQDEHATLSLLRYSRSGELRFAGGHEEIALLRARDERCSLIATPGPWIGGMRDISRVIQESHIALEKGDVFVLYTDGVIEARDAKGRYYGIERLESIVEQKRAEPVEAICEALVHDVSEFVHAQRDDLTVLVARYDGVAA
jgi:sigma-B regulation protein RsbU (phosphoserine phosphatase)